MNAAYYKTSLRWGLLHGLNDWVAGYMLANYALSANRQQALLGLILYSILAFGGQLPVGLWLDAKKNLKMFSLVSLILLLISCPLYFADPFTAIIVAGIASAGVHVTGGCICLLVHKEKFSPLGIFTAPGVAGLAIGGFCGYMDHYALVLPFAAVLVLLFQVIKSGIPVYMIVKKAKDEILDSHDFIMIVLLLLMCVRSFLFDLLNTFSNQFGYGLLVIGLSAFAGKLAGGFFADKIGWRRWVFITLPLSLVFLQMGHDNLLSLAFGVACLQSSVPITMQLMYNSVPHYPATASALSLGTIIAFAGLPLYISPWLHHNFYNSSPLFTVIVISMIVLLSIGFLFYVRRQRQYRV